jgi:hypothetical protein
MTTSTHASQPSDLERRLWRKAAEHGPGLNGRRLAAAPGELLDIAAEFRTAGKTPPAFLETPTDWIERRAKLFEAGDYPDKGVTVTPETLSALQQSFDAPVPVLIEHAHSPLELGYLTAVEAVGRELFGTVALTTEANALVERSGARSLSLGLSPDLASICEVSLVSEPRVASARLFSGLLSEAMPSIPAEPQSNHVTDDGHFSQRPAPGAEVARLIQEGRLLPAQAPFAEALLARREPVEFDGRRVSVGQLLLAMIERQPPRPLFAELAPVPTADLSQALMVPEEAEFYRRHFPDISLEEIAKRKSA